MTTTQPTFKTFSEDTGSYVWLKTGEVPHTVYVPELGQVSMQFYHSDAPAAAKAFRDDDEIQKYIECKKLNHQRIRQIMRTAAPARG